LWTLWQWRRQWRCRHLLAPLAVITIALTACLAMGRSDRALLLALPATAVLAAFALPTLRRSTAAAIDWFSMTLFTLTGLFLWVMYAAMQTGFPAKPAANVAKLAPSFQANLEISSLVLAIMATMGWLALVRWRTGRHRAALWKSMVLPAGGVALCWLLLMTLWMPLIDHDRSLRSVVEGIRRHVPPGACVAGADVPPYLVASLESIGRLQVDGRPEAGTRCSILLTTSRNGEPPMMEGWTRIATFSRPTDRRDQVSIHRRSELPAPGAAHIAAPAPPPAPRP
jgi:4-amino-4-deoxy-L-arabinose transferase-like glycosyltransferase